MDDLLSALNGMRDAYLSLAKAMEADDSVGLAEAGSELGRKLMDSYNATFALQKKIHIL